MTNEEKAVELLYQFNSCMNNGVSRDAAVMACLMEMAEWKDEQVKSCFILISKLIKDGLLKKDNPEHIMVEQMVELYNNLKI